MSSAELGYLAILMAGLLRGLGVRFEANRQYLDAWQYYLESQQMKSKDYHKRVKSFVSALNDNLGTLSFLPSVRKIAGMALTSGPMAGKPYSRSTIILPKKVAVTKVYIVPADIDAKNLDLETGRPEEPILTLDQTLIRSKSPHIGSVPTSPPVPAASQTLGFYQVQKQLQWFKINYPEIQRLKTSVCRWSAGLKL